MNFGCLVQVGKMYGLRSVAHDDILLLLTDDALIFLRELECVCVRERERERESGIDPNN